MAIAFVSQSGAAVPGGGGTNIARPVSAETGDLLVLHLIQSFEDGIDHVIPDGWSLRWQHRDRFSLAIAYRHIEDINVEPSEYHVIRGNPARAMIAAIQCFRGVDESDPFSTTSDSFSSLHTSSPVSVPSITTGDDNSAELVSVYAAGSITSSAPSGWTWAGAWNPGGSWPSFLHAMRIKESAGVTGVVSFPASASTAYRIAYHTALRPAGDADPDPIDLEAAADLTSASSLAVSATQQRALTTSADIASSSAFAAGTKASATTGARITATSSVTASAVRQQVVDVAAALASGSTVAVGSALGITTGAALISDSTLAADTAAGAIASADITSTSSLAASVTTQTGTSVSASITSASSITASSTMASTIAASLAGDSRVAANVTMQAAIATALGGTSHVTAHAILERDAPEPVPYVHITAERIRVMPLSIERNRQVSIAAGRERSATPIHAEHDRQEHTFSLARVTEQPPLATARTHQSSPLATARGKHGSDIAIARVKE